MTTTAIVWLMAFLFFTALTFRRSAWGVPLYMCTYFAHPPNWWWGHGFLTSSGIRWNLMAALIFAAGVIFDPRPKGERSETSTTRAFWLLLIYGVNASLVHLAGAANPDRSWEGLMLMWKQIGLFVLLWLSIRDEFDLKLLLYSIMMGSLYIAYEVVVNGRGHFAGSRLEGVGIPGAQESNYLAALLSLCIPIAGGLLLTGNKWEKIFAFVTLPLVLEVILRCNSRGAFLGLLVGAGWLIARSSGKIRKYAMIGVALGGMAAYTMIGDARIIDRFMSTFASDEERDRSADSRLVYWAAAMDMISDNPMGSGAEAAFKSDKGMEYLAQSGEYRYRAVHNGFLDIAASWGLQGLTLFIAAILVARRGARCAITWARSQSQEVIAFMGICIDATLMVQLVCSMFISSLDGEWFYWWIAMGLAYRRIYAVGVSHVKDMLNTTEIVEEVVEEDPPAEQPAAAGT